jgi:hypothetical protein
MLFCTTVWVALTAVVNVFFVAVGRNVDNKTKAIMNVFMISPKEIPRIGWFRSGCPPTKGCLLMSCG